MNRRRNNGLIASTPHPNRTRQVLSLFEDVECSPITEPSQLKVSQPIVQSKKPSGVRAVRKRTVATKEKAAPESVTAGVLKELGVKAQDVYNNALSHSRNLYNMFPEPIILDSDDEENSVIVTKPPKKSKQDSKVTQSRPTSSQEEKKIKEPVPGGESVGCLISRIKRLTRPAADRKLKKQTSAQCSSNVPSSSKDLKATSKTKPQTKRKPSCHRSSPSVVLSDDDDDDSFYQAGSSVHQMSGKNKIKAKNRYSIESDEKFPIEWSQRRQKTTTKIDEVPDVENIEVQEVEEVEKNNNKKKTINPRELVKRSGQGKSEVPNVVEPRSSTNENIRKKDGNFINGDKGSPVLISRFEEVVFKVSNSSGGIVSKCLKTARNDIGYLEVPEHKVFNGQSANVTLVVIEGKAKVLHLGTQQTLSPGDMLHITEESGYQFESEGAGHVRFLYIKEH